MGDLLLGIDIGTYSSKGVLCRPDGEVVADARADHGMSVPQPGYAEQDADNVWWADLVSLARSLMAHTPPGDSIAAIAVSAIGPCLLPIDDQGRPLRPGILYGVDTRATEQIVALEDRLGREALFALGGMRLTSQAIGPKLLWLREHEPEIYERAARFHTASSYLVYRLTGEHVIDRHTASHFNPLIDLARLEWDDRFADGVASIEQLPALRFGVVRPGDLMLMYGSTAFLILVTDGLRGHPDLWATAGALPGQHALAAGMATTGSATTWFRDQLGRDLDSQTDDQYARLVSEAADAAVGANGLLFLPYLSGERTPLHDADARGVIAGLSLAHTRGDLYRALLEGTAFGIRHIVETMRAGGAAIERVVAVGGGATSRLWLEIVSNIAGIKQLVPERTIGASYGDAFLAGVATGVVDGVDALDRDWVRLADRVVSDPRISAQYDALYPLFGDLYRGSAATVHGLARWQRERAAEGKPVPVAMGRSS
ncbi:MAG: sugar kinase [Chloroflexi bacterium]|nr:sugar kinase [Chloroflexota bacterium]